MEAGGGAAAGAPPGLALLAARQLGALGWPGAAPRGEAGWRAAVAWLEDTKVRGLPEGERGPLRAAAAPGWPAAFADYLARLECPLPGAGAGEGARGGGLPDARLGWLVSHAVMLEFQDRAPEYNAALAARQRRGGRGAGGDAGAAPPGAGGGLAAQLARGAGAPEAARLAGEMAEALGGAGAGGEGGDGGAAGLAGRLEACRKAVKRRQAAAAASAAAASGGGARSTWRASRWGSPWPRGTGPRRSSAPPRSSAPCTSRTCGTCRLRWTASSSRLRSTRPTPRPTPASAARGGEGRGVIAPPEGR